MPAQANPRNAAGHVIAELINYRGTTIAELGRRTTAISPPTIGRVLRGESVSDGKLMVLDGLLDLPPGTLRLVLAGDADQLRARAWREDDAYIRDFILSELNPPAAAKRRTRHSA